MASKRIVVDKYRKSNLPKTVNTDDIHLIFTDTNEFYINKIDGSLLKISDVYMTTYEKMIALTDADTSKLYVCTDKKSLYIHDGSKFQLLVGGESEALTALKQKVESISQSLDNYTESNDNAITILTNTINELSQKIVNLENDFGMKITEINEAITGSVQEINKVKNSIIDMSDNIYNLALAIDELKNTIDYINGQILDINKNIEELTKKVEKIEIDLPELIKRIEVVEKTSADIVKKMSVKEYHVEFTITDPISAMEVADIFDLSNLIFDEETESVTVESVTVKSSKKPTDTIVINVIHRDIDPDGLVSDNVITQSALPENTIENSNTIEAPTVYKKGYIVLKIERDGNHHDNVRIRLKIKKSIITI